MRDVRTLLNELVPEPFGHHEHSGEGSVLVALAIGELSEPITIRRLHGQHRDPEPLRHSTSDAKVHVLVRERWNPSVEGLIGDGYYGGAAADGWAAGTHYEDYSLTAEHTLLWARLFVEALRPTGGSSQHGSPARSCIIARP